MVAESANEVMEVIGSRLSVRVAWWRGRAWSSARDLRWVGVGPVAGEGEEDVVEVRRVDGECLGLDLGVVQAVEQGLECAAAAVVGDGQGARLEVAGRVAQDPGGGVQLAGVREVQLDVSAGDPPLEL